MAELPYDHPLFGPIHLIPEVREITIPVETWDSVITGSGGEFAQGFLWRYFSLALL
jgi:hypothetical protein